MRIIQEGYHYQSRREETATSLSTIPERLNAFFLSEELLRYMGACLFIFGVRRKSITYRFFGFVGLVREKQAVPLTGARNVDVLKDGSSGMEIYCAKNLCLIEEHWLNCFLGI